MHTFNISRSLPTTVLLINQHVKLVRPKMWYMDCPNISYTIVFTVNDYDLYILYRMIFVNALVTQHACSLPSDIDHRESSHSNMQYINWAITLNTQAPPVDVIKVECLGEEGWKAKNNSGEKLSASSWFNSLLWLCSVAGSWWSYWVIHWRDEDNATCSVQR